MKRIMKMIIKINIILLPMMLALNMIRASNDVEGYVDYGYFEYYIQKFPTEPFTETLDVIGSIGTEGEVIEPLEPDWSGSLLEDVQEALNYMLGIFKNIWNVIKWLFQVLWKIILDIIYVLRWVLLLPYDVIHYGA